MNWWTFKRRVHSSWLVAALSFGVVIGVITAQYIAGEWASSTLWLLAALSLIMVGFWRHTRYALALVFFGGGMVGLWRGSLTQQELTPYSILIGHTVTVVGTVNEDPDLGKNDELVLRLGGLQIEGHHIAGTIWVSAGNKPDIKRSDRVTIKGKLASGFGSFAASMYRANIAGAQRPQPGDAAARVRDWLAGGVRKAVPEPEASLGVGFLVGQRRNLSPELNEALRMAGLTHVIVASGYNLTILVRLARRLFVKVSKYLATLSAGSMIVTFMAITGVSPSMSRAGLVAGLSLLAWYYGRKFHPLVLLPFAAAITLLINPSYGWNDLGWQLSFAAFGGVMVIAPLAQRYFFGNKKPGTVRQILGETISAQIATLPLLVLAFGQFSNVAIIANLLVLPLVPLAMLLTFFAGIGVLVIPSAAFVVGAPAYWLLQYMTSVTQYLAGVEWAQTKLSITIVVVVVYYALLTGMCLYAWRKTKFNLREGNIVE